MEHYGGGGLAVGIHDVRVARDQGSDNHNGGVENGQPEAGKNDAKLPTTPLKGFWNGLNQNQNVVLGDPGADAKEHRAASVVEAAEQQIELSTTSLG
jgi:hypothetical protein